MKISIAMTTYNGEAYIEKQIRSLLHQTRIPDEIIICDDGSSDATIDILQRVLNEEGCSFCRVIKNEKNLGYRKNFKKSIGLTTGDLIFLSDQDDIWEKEKLEIMETVFEKNPHITALNSAFTLIDGLDKEIPYKERKGFLNHGFMKKTAGKDALIPIEYGMLLRYNISPGCTMAFSRCVKDMYLKSTKSILPHDWEINLISGMQGGCYFLNTPLIRYRIHGKNTLGMSTDDHPSVLEFRQDIDFRKASIKEKLALFSIMDGWNRRCRIDEKKMKVYNKIKRFDRLRAQAVLKHKKSSWIELFFMTCMLWDGKYIRFKSLFGDLFYTIRRAS